MSRLFLIENPLLDISIELQDNTLLDKYELQKGMACLATDKQMPIYDEIYNMAEVQLIPGGSALNSARSANYMLKHAGITEKVTYFGSIGKDDKGKVLENDIISSGIEGNFHKEEDTPTGTCAVIVVQKERSLCANLAAACKYNIEHLNANIDSLKQAKIIYSTSFFITSNFEALMKVARYASENDIPFGYNLSACFLLMFELPKVLEALEHADYIFGNEDEAAEFAKTQGMPGASLTEVAKVLAKWKKVNQKRPRIAIVTQGPQSVIVAVNHPGSEEVELTEFPVPKVPEEQIVDTNGAGDAFVGGFLSQLYQDKDIATCVKVGINLSVDVVKRSGCTFPEQINWTV